MLYASGKEYVLYSYRLHNGKKRIEAFFPYCRYPTKEFIRQRFDAARAVLIHDIPDDSWYFVRERSNQIGRFANTGDFLLDTCGEFHQSKEFEFHNPRIVESRKEKRAGRVTSPKIQHIRISSTLITTSSLIQATTSIPTSASSILIKR